MPHFLVSLILLFCCSVAGAGNIAWRVENNFRLIKEPAAQAWIKHIAREGINAETTTLKRTSVEAWWTRVPDTYYDSNTWQYEDGYVDVRTWDVALSLPGARRSDQCTWTIGAEVSVGPCIDHRVRIGMGPNPVTVVTADGRRANDSIEATDLLVVGLGDSYASGEGVPDVRRRPLFGIADREGTRSAKWIVQQPRRSRWLDEKCHRSLYSWQVLTAALLADDNPHHSVTFVSRACSGALIGELFRSTSDGLAKRSKSADGSTTLPPQLTALRRDLCTDWRNGTCPRGLERQPDLILLSIGGNDAGFGKVIFGALLGEAKQKELAKLRRAGLDLLHCEYPQLAKAIFRQYPDTRVVMTTYPDPLHKKPAEFCGETQNYSRDLPYGLRHACDRKTRWNRELDFTGFSLFPKRIREKEVPAIYRDFVVPLVGQEASAFTDGLLQIGQALQQEYGEQWRVVQMLQDADPPAEGVSPTGQTPPPWGKQADGYQPVGYCVRGCEVDGRWTLTATDSWHRINRPSFLEVLKRTSGAGHPNLFGQLFYVSKVYPVANNRAPAPASPRVQAAQVQCPTEARP